MRIAVLSGKGGAGKTMVSVNLAASAPKAVYIDCDVEEPNGRLFLKPENITEKPVCTLLPVFDLEKCNGCRKCVDFCRFNAIIYIKDRPKVFSEVCHSCGGCKMVCSQGAISEEGRPVGHVEQGKYKNVDVVTGVLDLGEASGVPIIKSTQETGFAIDTLNIIDCPPGSACSVMESVTGSDYCILVVEPTAFGFHNFLMVYELVSLMDKPCGVIVNKMDRPYEPLEEFCNKNSLPILMRIPYSEKLARLAAAGEVLVEHDSELKESFKAVLKKIGGAVK